jgi:hypothetical protein
MEWAAAYSEIDKPFSSHRAVARFRELHWLSYFDLGLTPQALC